MGLTVAEICLLNFRKIPFACSHLPGQSRIHILFLGAFGLLLGSVRMVLIEHDALNELGTAAIWVASFALVWLVARLAVWFFGKGVRRRSSSRDDAGAIQTLGLGAD